MANNDLIKAPEAAEILGVHIDTLRRMPNGGQGVPYQRYGKLGWRRYRRSDVEAFRDGKRFPLNTQQ